MKRIISAVAVAGLCASAASVWALGIEMQGGLGLGSLKPSKPANITQAMKSVNSFCGEGSLGVRVNRRLSGGLSAAWSLSKYDLDLGVGGNWETTQALVSGNLYGQYNFMTGRLRPYLRAEVGTFAQATTVIDTTTNSAVVGVGTENGLHYSAAIGGELGFTKRFYGFLQAEYQGFQFDTEPTSLFNAQIGIGYTFANVFDF